MKPSLQLRTSQNLAMTPQLQQAIRLLQLSSMELQMEVQQALESNMMLELDEGDESNEIAEQQFNDNDTATVDVAADEGKGGIDADNIPDDLPVDSAWEDIYDNPAIYTHNNPAESDFYENQGFEENSLRNHLLWQLNVMPVSDKDKAIAVSIIDALDDDGYLSCGFNEILESLGDGMDAETDELAAVLHLVQSMEPAGVAARDLRECLLLQLDQCDPATPHLAKAKELVSGHLQLMASHDFTQLMRRLQINQDNLQEIITLIQSMNPRPGSLIQTTQTEYVIPDVYVKKAKGAWKVELNTDAIPQLKINTKANESRNSVRIIGLRLHLEFRFQ